MSLERLGTPVYSIVHRTVFFIFAHPIQSREISANFHEIVVFINTVDVHPSSVGSRDVHSSFFFGLFAFTLGLLRG